MEKYNKKILESTRKLSNKSYRKAMNDAYEATHPLPKVLKKGARVSSGIGAIMVVAGAAGLVIGKNSTIAVGAIISGTIIAVVNLTNATKN